MNYELFPTSVGSVQPFDAKHPMFGYNVEQLPSFVRDEWQEYERFVVVGLGGSVLPLKAFVDFFDLSDKILFLDTVDPLAWKRVPKDAKTLFCVASKSGETLEIKTLVEAIRSQDLLAQTMVVTDPNQGWLRELSKKENLPSLTIPATIGGRFTNFTCFHQALLERFSIPFEAMRQSAKDEVGRLVKNPQPLEHLYQQIFQSGKGRLILWGYSGRFQGLLEWTQQVIAESLGKISKSGKRTGVFPIVLKGPQDQHAVLQLLRDGPLDEILWFYEIKDKASQTSSLSEAMDILMESTFQSFFERTSDSQLGQPLARWTFETRAQDIGAYIGLMQAFIEYAGERLAVNAFDQPGVERGKEIARALLKARRGA